MRGEHLHEAVRYRRLHGIIPACAGSTIVASSGAIVGRGSSPHARGALGDESCAAFSSRGSSPHARGAPGSSSAGLAGARDHPRMRGEHGLRRVRIREQVGIIPACAGSTFVMLSLIEFGMGSSPHARGARGRAPRSSPGRGDHPRMRGEHRRGRRGRDGLPRIIPACAGSTSMEDMTVPSHGDHPRMRGEHGERPFGA